MAYECTEVSLRCPVQATVLGYAPNLGSGIFFTIAFGLCFLAALGLGIRSRTWTFCAAVSIGSALEMLGYIGRSLLNKNPWDQPAFELQICTIIIAPTFICASIYLTLKHVALALNPSMSRIAPQWYPRIFLPADVSCLILQAIGGGVAASAGATDRTVLRVGNDIIIAGIVLQVVVLAVFGLLAGDYYLRVRRWFASGEASSSPAALAVWNDAKFRKFAAGIAAAYSAVLIRCIYRIAEMAGGWGNTIMQDEPSFLVLDASLVAVAVYLLTIFHPGIYFPQMSNSPKIRAAAASAGSSSTAPDAEPKVDESSSKETPPATGVEPKA